MIGTGSRMNQENALRTFRHAGFVLALLLPVMAVAFWKSYLGILSDLPERLRGRFTFMGH